MRRVIRRRELGTLACESRWIVWTVSWERRNAGRLRLCFVEAGVMEDLLLLGADIVVGRPVKKARRLVWAGDRWLCGRVDSGSGIVQAVREGVHAAQRSLGRDLMKTQLGFMSPQQKKAPANPGRPESTAVCRNKAAVGL